MIVFLSIVLFNIHKLICEIGPSVKNYKNYVKTKDELYRIFYENKEIVLVNNFEKIDLKKISVSFDNKVKIEIPEFELLKKDHIGILGKSGQGKSTVLNVLSGFVKENKGSYMIDSKKNHGILDCVYIDSKTSIFEMSLRDNILFGKDITDDELFELFDKLKIKDWYEELSDGLDTILNLDIVNDNIRMKLNLIRALYLKSNLYLFDDPTYSMDIENEKIIANIIKKEFDNKTYILVSSRPILTNICQKHYFIKEHKLLEKETLL